MIPQLRSVVVLVLAIRGFVRHATGSSCTPRGSEDWDCCLRSLCVGDQSFKLKPTMKRQLILLSGLSFLLLTQSGPSLADDQAEALAVDERIHQRCIGAKDYAGCYSVQHGLLTHASRREARIDLGPGSTAVDSMSTNAIKCQYRSFSISPAR